MSEVVEPIHHLEVTVCPGACPLPSSYWELGSLGTTLLHLCLWGDPCKAASQATNASSGCHGPVLFILLFTISLLPRRAQQSGVNLSKFSDVLALLFIGMYYYLYFKLNSHSYMCVKL